MRPLSTRTKKFIGIVAMLLWLVFYSLLAMSIAVLVLPNAHWTVQLLYYAIVGTAWIIPIGLMLPWMHREDR